MSPKDTAYIIEQLAIRFMAMVADHERQLAEHRAAFGARTEADAKIIAGLREERDGLLTQVQDMRAELRAERDRLLANLTQAEAESRVARDALRAEVAALQERLRASIARGDFAQMEVAALKSQTSKHPVAVGEWVECILTDACDQRHPLYRIGSKGRVGRIVERPNYIFEYHVTIGSDQVWWESSYCIPCDPPEATHDMPEGKQAAESAAKTEPVADEIKVGDVVEVFQSTASCTFKTDIGTRGTVLQLDDSCVDTAPLDGFLAPKCNHVALCDVWKVTT